MMKCRHWKKYSLSEKEFREWIEKQPETYRPLLNMLTGVQPTPYYTEKMKTDFAEEFRKQLFDPAKSNTSPKNGMRFAENPPEDLNLAHPDADALHAIQEKYYAHIRFASLLGCGMVGTETGAPNAEYKFCPECRSDEALATFIKNFKPVVRCAEQYGVTIAIEPVVKHIVYDARRARTVLDEIGSPNLQILFDPVNLLNMENVDRREEVFAEAIELLGKDIAMIHFKDFLRKDAGGQLAATGAGQGGMEDYRTILRFAKQEKPYIFATLENTTPENAVECLNYLKKQYDEC